MDRCKAYMFSLLVFPHGHLQNSPKKNVPSDVIPSQKETAAAMVGIQAGGNYKNGRCLQMFKKVTPIWDDDAQWQLSKGLKPPMR